MLRYERVSTLIVRETPRTLGRSLGSHLHITLLVLHAELIQHVGYALIAGPGMAQLLVHVTHDIGEREAIAMTLHVLFHDTL